MAQSVSFEVLCNRTEPISVDFTVDYSMDDPEENLGALSAFIIDIDMDITTALIRVEYKLKTDERVVQSILGLASPKKGDGISIEDVRYIIENNFQKLFETVIYAINPRHPEEKQRKKLDELNELFPIFFIRAERRLGEDGTHDSSLASLISEYFETNEDELDPRIVAQVILLRNLVEDNSRTIQQKSDEILSELVSNAVGFGYPNGEELQLGVQTELSVDEQIINKAQLTYISEACEGLLPSTHNGLGYKNLIKMEFLLATFAKSISACGNACMPLLFIEEPESHMHPQMQRAFAEYLEEFLEKIASMRIQTVLTTHSAHIANTMDFSKIRYARRTEEGAAFKNLNSFAQEAPSNTDFIRKYLTLTKCDLFFADKVIFVEGASERLLLPDMIEKCDRSGDFDSREYKLCDQYYSLIEVGGAYAYLFVPFVRFLDIPCLILTDLDSVSASTGRDGRRHYRSSFVSQGETTSNQTIKWWTKQLEGTFNKAGVTALSDILLMAFEEKTLDNCHIEFQTTEFGLCGRSLEEAIKNVNRAHYNLSDNPSEEDIEFSEKSKTDFALDLIINYKDYIVPEYIKSGLKWLNEQNVLE